ncbi:MAG: hypothetical protein ABSB59_41055 [Streptosporangiaceae bacterium]
MRSARSRAGPAGLGTHGGNERGRFSRMGRASAAGISRYAAHHPRRAEQAVPAGERG